MTTLAITLTNIGLARIVSAQNGGTNAVVIAAIGLSAANFVAAPTLTGLPGEFKRIGAVSGAAVDATTIHMTARDLGADAYTVRSFGLFLADGTLFGAYSQAGSIFEKASVSTFLLAFDIKFAAGQVGVIQFGDANFLYPPASEDRKGVAELATQAEVDAAADEERIVTPKTLAARIAAVVTTLSAAIAARALGTRGIAAAGLATGGGDLTADRTIDVPKATAAEVTTGTNDTKAVTPAALAGLREGISGSVPAGRKVATSGLATGGGDLSADRTIDVPKATAAEVAAGANDTKAVTPAALAALAGAVNESGYCKLFGGLILMWGRFTSGANGTTAVTFPMTFPGGCFSVVQGGGRSGSINSQDNPPVLLTNTITASGFSIFSAVDTAIACTFIAIGN